MDDSCLTDLAGYKIHYGTSPGSYSSTETVSVGTLSCNSSSTSNACGTIQTCTYTVHGLPAGTWYFAIQAFDATAEESGHSNVAVKIVP